MVCHVSLGFRLVLLRWSLVLSYVPYLRALHLYKGGGFVVVTCLTTLGSVFLKRGLLCRHVFHNS
jgi:hypothetical protein